MAVTLNKSELAAVSKLSPATQEQARKDILARKEADQAAYLARPDVQERLARNQKNRTEFRVVQSLKQKDVAVVYGLGRRFGVALHKSEFLILFANIDVIKTFVATLPEA